MSTNSQQDFHLRAYVAEDRAQALDVLNAAFGRRENLEWFQWKHEHGPWGPSSGWVVEDSGGTLVAVRLITPWRIWGPSGTVPIERAMDGAVAPAARRQGHFTRCIRAEMEALSSGIRRARLVYSTSVPASREAYQKLGWRIRDVPHMAWPTVPSPVRAVQLVWDEALDRGESPRGQMGATVWSRDALKWRLDPRSGRRYRTVRLRQSESDHGAVVRVAVTRGIRVMVVVFEWGARREVDLLLRAAATRLGAPVTLAVASAGQVAPWARRVGGSCVSAWAPSRASTPGLEDLAFSFADVEGGM